MALLRIDVGALSSTVTASDANAANVLSNVAELHNFEGTNQEKLDQVVELIRKILTRESVRYSLQVAECDAQTAVYEDVTQRFED